jgi:hypothetical protein
MAVVAWAGGVQNGAIPASMLVSIGTYDGDQMLLNPAAAAAYEQWAAEWKRQEGSDLITDEANRSLARQQYLYNGYKAGLPGFYVAAIPGTSTHGEALAVDILSTCYSKDIDQHQRLVDMGLKYGWSWYTVGKPSGESWHFNYINNPLAIPAQAKDWFDMADKADLDASTDAAANKVIDALKPGAPLARRAADGSIGIFGADFVEDGVAEPARLGKRGRRIFKSIDEYATFKSICDTINANSGDAPVLPTIDKVVSLDETGWAAFNEFYQEP